MEQLRVPGFLHGGDYNPDQWLDCPEVLEKDVVLMKEAGVNCVSLAIFAWVALEPEEGVYTFDWLRERIETLHKHGIYTILATPSGSRPAWMAVKYPEVLRVNNHGVRQQLGGRHNHCYTSPIYREKVGQINRKLSEEFGNHPAVILWHLSNEYGGSCYCPLCQQGFRDWLRVKYGSLDALNKAWWTGFWSHTYTDWNQINAPMPHGEMWIHGLVLDWKRYVTHMTVDFCAHEKASVRAGGSDLPVTTNFMGFYDGLNYHRFKDIVDLSSFDSYPQWHVSRKGDVRTAVETACTFDLMWGVSEAPFLLMESTPSTTNWMSVSKLKRPGVHMLSSLQAVAHGSDSVQYFQWRKGRGSTEKFHGAVVDHYGESTTRIFQDVAQLGKRLQNMEAICGAGKQAKVAIIFDQENRWIMDDIQGPRNAGLRYIDTVIDYYEAFWKLGISVNIIDAECATEGYDLIVAPMLYMLRGGMEDKLRRFTEQGGTLVATYLTGVVNEHDLCFTGGMPGKLMDVFGLRMEETDALADGEHNHTSWKGKEYVLERICERLIPSTAEVMMTYQDDFYAGEPVVCKNSFHQGHAYYIAAASEQALIDDIIQSLTTELGLNNKEFPSLPKGTTVTTRHGDKAYHFIQNYNDFEVSIPCAAKLKDFETGEELGEAVMLKAWEVKIATQG